MPEIVQNEDGYEAIPADAEPPEGDVELALQEDLVGTDSPPPPAPAPPVVGRTYQIDFETSTLLLVRRVPASINGPAAMRQACEKCLRTPRGSAAVQGDEYGLEGAARDVEGQPFDAAAFADREDAIREALLGLPWVLAVEDFGVVEEPQDTSTGALVTFRVVPEGEDDPAIVFDAFPLPAT